MRQIKFRAWDNARKVMHHDFQFIKSGDCENGNDWIIPVNIKNENWIKELHENIMLAPHFRAQLDIMQFTGLHDKNGKEIWEGDVYALGDFMRGEVFFETNYGRWSIQTKGGQHDLVTSEKDWQYSGGEVYELVGEVLGNIYENKELLNVV